jgi:hypothetical protein
MYSTTFEGVGIDLGGAGDMAFGSFDGEFDFDADGCVTAIRVFGCRWDGAGWKRQPHALATGSWLGHSLSNALERHLADAMQEIIAQERGYAYGRHREQLVEAVGWGRR